MVAVEFLGRALYVLFFISIPIGIIWLAYVAIREFLDTFKEE